MGNPNFLPLPLSGISDGKRKEGNGITKGAKQSGRKKPFFLPPLFFHRPRCKIGFLGKSGKRGGRKKVCKKVRKGRCNYCGTAAAAPEQKEEGKIGVFFQRFLSLFPVFSVRREGRQCIKLFLFRPNFLSYIVLAAA